MSDMWRSRAPPTPLDFDGIMDGTFVLRRNEQTETRSNAKADDPRKFVNGNGHASGSKITEQVLNGTESTTGLKDQRKLTLRDNLMLFISRFISCFKIDFLPLITFLARIGLLHASKWGKTRLHSTRTMTIRWTLLLRLPIFDRLLMVSKERLDGK